MKNFIVAFLLLAAVVVGVGAYRGWFTVNKARIQQDEDTAKTELHDLGQQVKEKTSGRKDPAKENK
jgi:hypothetical protein